MAALAGSKVLSSSVCQALCTAAVASRCQPSLHSVWLWWSIGVRGGLQALLECWKRGVAPSRAGVVGQLRGWLLAGTGVRQWDVGDVGSGDESNLALVVRGWAKHRPKMPSMRHVLGKWRMSNPNRLEEEAGARGQALPRGACWFGAAR